MQQKQVGNIHSLPSFPLQFVNVSKILNAHLENPSLLMYMLQSLQVFGPVFALSGSSTLTCHSSSSLFLQQRPLRPKTRYIQGNHAVCLRIPPLHRTHRCLPLEMNGLQICSAANANQASNNWLRCFSHYHKEHTPHDMWLDDRVYTAEMFA